MSEKEIKDLIEQEGNNKKFTYKGYECEIKRIPGMGHLCGYVKLKQSIAHSFIDDIECHGGITFNENGVIGFDCAHLMDLIPLMPSEFYAIKRGTYRDMEYCQNECKSIVDQLVEYEV